MSAIYYEEGAMKRDMRGKFKKKVKRKVTPSLEELCLGSDLRHIEVQASGTRALGSTHFGLSTLSY